MARSIPVRVRRGALNGGTYVLLLAYTVVSLVPLLWMLSTAFKPASQLFASPPVWIPSPIVFQHFIDILEQVPFANMFLNTVLMSVIVMIGQVVLGALAAYAFARVRFAGRQLLFTVFLFGLMVPPIVVMVPLFAMLRSLGMVDSLAGLTVPQIFAFGTPTLIVFFMRQYFLTLPEELEEAATVDGAGLLRTLWSVILPNARPALATGASLSLVATWNALLWPLLVINEPNKYVLTVGVGTLIGQFREADWGMVMAGCTLVLAPIVIAFIVLQKHFLRSVSTSGLK